jgi:hypothetical protein
MSNEKCREISIARGHKYYSLQYGGQCFTSNDIYRAKSYGRLPDWRCNMRGKTGRTSWTQRQGGGWANDVYHTRKLPHIRHCGTVRVNGQYVNRIKTAQGPNCAHNELGWVEISFETEPSTVVDKKFCPDPRYTEFNGAACSDGGNRTSCITSKFRGFKPDSSMCVNKLKVSHSNYENKDFYTIISAAMSRNYKYASKSATNKLLSSLEDVMKLACAIKSTADNAEYDDDEKCSERVYNMFSKNKDQHLFFGYIADATKLCSNPKIGNPQLCRQFKELLKEAVHNARIINFSTNDKQYKCSCPTDQYTQNHKIIKTNHECKSKDQWLGWKRSIKDCAEACDSKKGCKYFIFGKGKKRGRCYWEKTKTDSCSEGWERDLYDFAKVDKRKCGPC